MLVLNYKERFLNIMKFKPVDEIPNFEGGIWPQTKERWEAEGMPKNALEYGQSSNLKNNELIDDIEVFWYHDVPLFGLSHIEFAKINTYKPKPYFDKTVIMEDERMIVYRDESGVIHKALKDGMLRGTRTSMDQYIDFPVKDRKSFNEMKKRYTADLSRYPTNWEIKCTEWKNRELPLSLSYIGEFGYYSLLRRWMGTEGASLIFYDDPKLVEEIFDFLTNYIIELFDKALNECDYDCFHIFEDMAFNNGPLISPQMVRKYMLPQYKKLIGHLGKYNIKNIWIDCDGDIDKLIPIWIEAGINCVIPCEVKAGSDPVKIRKKYGKDMALIGGINKYILTQTKKDIENEVRGKCDYLLPIGGYIPTLDHLAPPDIPYENFLYYIDIKSKCLKGQL